MNSEFLLAHFNRISEAPDAVPRLRRFILELAVRGKLVEHDPTDQPASQLLTRIRAEKERLVKEGDIKHREQSITAGTGCSSFPAPPGWVPTTLGEVAHKITDGAHKTPSYVDQGVPFISVKDFSGGTLDFSNTRLIPHKEHAILYKRCDPRRGDILIARIGTLGKAVLVDTDREFSLFVSVGLIRFSQEFIAPLYFRLVLNSPLLENEYNRIKVGGGTHTNKLNLADLHTVIFPLPPLAEQYRIVAKVDELTALCDHLEAARNEQESRRDRLAAASQHHLNSDASAETFHTHARFYLNHLPRLTIRPKHVQHLRQTILNLAVRGQLVPQDPDDDPASELLKRIRTEIVESLRAGDTKESSECHANATKDAPFDIPRSWLWVTLDQLAFGFRYGTSVKCSYEQTGEPVLRIPNVVNGGISVEDLKFGPLTKRGADELRLRLGDILMVRSNGSLDLVGRPALVDANAVGYCYAGYLIRVRISPTNLAARYILLALGSTHVREQIEVPIRTTVGLKNVNATELGGLAIPLPPLPEQHRIVAKLDELTALCDRLEAQLTHAAIQSRGLLEAVLHHAFDSSHSPIEKESAVQA